MLLHFIACFGLPFSSQNAHAKPTDPELLAGFELSNQYRISHQVAPFVWDKAIADSAAAFAAGCPRGHSGADGLGENLAWGHRSLSAATEAWYREVDQYSFANPGWSPSTGHFTQLVWKDSTRVGCAINRNCSMVTYVCQYAPAGNVIGLDWSEQVKPLKGNPVPPTQSQNPTVPPGRPNIIVPQTGNTDAGSGANQTWNTRQDGLGSFFRNIFRPGRRTPPRIPPSGISNQIVTAPSPKPSAPGTVRPSPSPSPKPSNKPNTKPSPTPSPQSTLPPASMDAALKRTNFYRARHRVPGVVWDAGIAAKAQAFANTCPSGHSGTRGVGENMAWGYPNWGAAIDAWYNEVSSYDYSRPGWNPATGHFTQLVWRDTTKMGCGYNAKCRMPTYVCQYVVPGNVIGTDWSTKVLKP